MSEQSQAQPCRECGRTLDAHTDPSDDAKHPKPGDVSICLYCGCISIYANDQTLREQA